MSLLLNNIKMKPKQPQGGEWEDEYCEKFGLCKKGGKCQCSRELKFIKSLLAKERANTLLEVNTLISTIFLKTKDKKQLDLLEWVQIKVLDLIKSR